MMAMITVALRLTKARLLVLLLIIIGMEVVCWPAQASLLAALKVSRKAIHVVQRAVEEVRLHDLIRSGERLSKEAIHDVLKERVSIVVLEHVKKNPQWSFDIGSGKLTTSMSVRVGSGQVKLEEANVYKITSIFAAPIAACLVIEKIDEKTGCVEKTLKSAGVQKWRPGDPRSMELEQ
jgi:hypothetical protein